MDGRGEVLRARGGGVVLQDLHRAVVGGVPIGLPLLRLDLPSFERSDEAAGEKLVSGGDRFIDVTARVAAEVDDQLPRVVLVDGLERGAELRRRPLLEERDLDVRDMAELL